MVLCVCVPGGAGWCCVFVCLVVLGGVVCVCACVCV